MFVTQAVAGCATCCVRTETSVHARQGVASLCMSANTLATAPMSAAPSYDLQEAEKAHAMKFNCSKLHTAIAWHGSSP